ncbi:Pyridoxal phosphate-dependent transferase [Phytophthora cactorum]|nr:Pyridoxal phosphate-dependent transferase [Phytophthora cactorum]
MASSSAALQQSLGESEVFDLVCDYLRTRQFFEAERTLRSEREATSSPRAASPVAAANAANQQDATPSEDASGPSLASRLEFMLERSYVTQLVSGTGQAEPEKIFVPRHELETSPKRARANLDGNEALEIEDVNRNTLEEGDDEEFNISTRIVSFEACKDDPHGSATMPIYQTSTFAQPSGTTFGAYDYTRSGNPTRAALERQMAELEGGHRAFAFTSGMAALSAVSRLAHAGTRSCSLTIIWWHLPLLSKVATKNGVTNGPKNLLAALGDKTKLVMMESPTNPCSASATSSVSPRLRTPVGALLSVDNTMMSPILQNLSNSFICGHSDTMSGTSSPKTRSFANAEGTRLAPFDCWLLLRGVKTMSLRVLAAQKNAAKVANFLNDHPLIKTVHYTNLLPENSPDRKIHDSQARGCGSVVCFRTGSLAFSQHLLTYPEEVRKARSFPEDLVRLSIGVEDAKDLTRISRRRCSRTCSSGDAVKRTKTQKLDSSSGTL